MQLSSSFPLSASGLKEHSMPNNQRPQGVPLPSSYRQEIVPTIMRCIQAGDSCAVVGVTRIGKTNLLRFLCRQDVQEKYLGSDAHRSLFILLDANQAPDLSDWQNYVPFLEGLRGVVKKLGERANKVAGYLTDFEDISRSDLHEGSRRLRACLQELCGGLGLRVIFMIDQFDRPFQELEDDFFVTLRGFRDALEGDCKYQLCYIIALGKAPGAIRPEFEMRCKPFHELLAGNIYGLKPYKEPDTRCMIQRLAHRYEVAMPDERHVWEILRLTGGHGGLLRAVFDVWLRGQWPSGEDVVSELLAHSAVRLECDKIWQSLDPEERSILGLIAREQDWPKSEEDVVLYLRAKGLVDWQPSARTAKVFCPLFKVYATRQPILLR
jgi:hypothetical protein